MGEPVANEFSARRRHATRKTTCLRVRSESSRRNLVSRPESRLRECKRWQNPKRSPRDGWSFPLESVQKPFHEPQSGQIITVSFRCNPRRRVKRSPPPRTWRGAPLPFIFNCLVNNHCSSCRKPCNRVKCRFSVRWRESRQEGGSKTKSFVMTKSLRCDMIEK
jgi:hypothetical protein